MFPRIPCVPVDLRSVRTLPIVCAVRTEDMQADYKLKRKFLLEKVVDSKVVREKRIKILADAKRLDAQAQGE